MDEERLDRRMHWAYGVGTLLVLGTVAFVTVKLTLAQLDNDFKDYKKEQKYAMKDMDNRLDALSDRVIHLEDWREFKGDGK